jgi:hypothetical protein
MEINHTYITSETTRCVTFSTVILPLLCHLNASISRRTHSRTPTPLDDTSWRILPDQKNDTVWGRNLSNLTYSETNLMPTFLLYNHMWLFYSYLQQWCTYIYSFFLKRCSYRGLFPTPRWTRYEVSLKSGIWQADQTCRTWSTEPTAVRKENKPRVQPQCRLLTSHHDPSTQGWNLNILK